MPPKKDSKKGKEKYKSQSHLEITKAEEPETKTEDVQPPDYRMITITLECYQDVTGLYPVSDISTKCTYREDIGETECIPVTDEEKIPIDFSASFQLDVNNMKELDQLISSPAVLTVSQVKGNFDPSLYEQLVTNEEVLQSPTKSYDSIVSIYEAITGQTLDVSFTKGTARSKKKSEGNKKEKKDKGEKEQKSKKSKSSVGTSSASTKAKIAKSDVSIGPSAEVYGICMIDFIPLFYGKSSFTETLLIKPTKKSLDHKMIPYKNHPKITITVSIDKELYFKDSNILSLTIESIYNIPELMSPGQSYIICAMIPMEGPQKVPVHLTNPLYTNTNSSATNLCWPNTQAMANDSNTTKYKINPDTTNIINKLDTDIAPFLEEECPKLQFNMIKRSLLLADGMSEFATHIKLHRRLILELFMTAKRKLPTNASQTNIFDSKKAKNQPFLHLMVLLDLAALIYPGVSRIRLACPLRTFSYDEAHTLGGLTDSYFLPINKNELKEAKEADGREAKAEKKGKKDKSTSSKSSKSSKKQNKGKGNDAQDKSMKNLLPPKPEHPPEPEPSLQVYNEDKKPCFIIVELELLRSLMPKEEVEDLSDKLYDLLQTQPEEAPKVVLTECLAKDFYKHTISEIIRDLNKHYVTFVEQNVSSSQMPTDAMFVKFLQKIGVYQKYVSSITKAATSLVSNKFSSENLTNSKENLSLVSEVFVQLVSEMHDAVNKLICSKMDPPQMEELPADELYLYAKEAAQMGNLELADRYFMERICDNQKKADYWLDYAVFQLELSNPDIAFECVQKALAADPNHKYGLLMMGALLYEKGMKDNAETCFLNLMVQQQKWLEGWATLYIFYQMTENPGGMDMSLEMAQKYDESVPQSDYISKVEDLLWSERICPNTKFFRTACIYLKLRLYNWVEYALAHETQNQYAIVNYLLAANCYYKKLYSHALEHVKEAENYYGIDCNVGSLYGHCLMALEKYEEASEQFHHVLESFNRPKNIHLVNLNCALAEEKLGNDQEARKFVLISCKYNPSPYTWLRAGQLYFKQNDILSAEECFSEANLRDNRNAEIWAHLCLVNLRLDRKNEAMLCYDQVLQNNFSDKEFLASLSQELKTVCT